MHSMLLATGVNQLCVSLHKKKTLQVCTFLLGHYLPLKDFLPQKFGIAQYVCFNHLKNTEIVGPFQNPQSHCHWHRGVYSSLFPYVHIDKKTANCRIFYKKKTRPIYKKPNPNQIGNKLQIQQLASELASTKCYTCSLSNDKLFACVLKKKLLAEPKLYLIILTIF